MGVSRHRRATARGTDNHADPWHLVLPARDGLPGTDPRKGTPDAAVAVPDTATPDHTAARKTHRPTGPHVQFGAAVAAAVDVGKRVAERAIEAGLKEVVFDRGGNRYHGRVKALASAAREAGLQI